MLRFILGIIIGVVVIIFMVQNTAPVFVSFFGLTGSLPTAVILLIVFAGGIIIGWIFRSAGKRRRDRSKNRK